MSSKSGRVLKVHDDAVILQGKLNELLKQDGKKADYDIYQAKKDGVATGDFIVARGSNSAKEAWAVAQGISVVKMEGPPVEATAEGLEALLGRMSPDERAKFLAKAAGLAAAPTNGGPAPEATPVGAGDAKAPKGRRAS